jgi:hypothetical protein
MFSLQEFCQNRSLKFIEDHRCHFSTATVAPLPPSDGSP